MIDFEEVDFSERRSEVSFDAQCISVVQWCNTFESSYNVLVMETLVNLGSILTIH